MNSSTHTVSIGRGLGAGLAATVVLSLLMIIVMPMAGAGLFGLQLGLMAPIATLMLHWIYGAVLGGVYGAGRTPASATDTGAQHARHA